MQLPPSLQPADLVSLFLQTLQSLATSPSATREAAAANETSLPLSREGRNEPALLEWLRARIQELQVTAPAGSGAVPPLHPLAHLAAQTAAFASLLPTVLPAPQLQALASLSAGALAADVLGLLGVGGEARLFFADPAEALAAVLRAALEVRVGSARLREEGVAGVLGSLRVVALGVQSTELARALHILGWPAGAALVVADAREAEAELNEKVWLVAHD